MKLKYRIHTGSLNMPFASECEWEKDIPLHIVHDLPEGRIRSVTASLQVRTTGNEKLFMNGFQTWTVSRERARNNRQRGLNGLPRAVIDRFSLDRYGDYHFVEYPYTRGFSHGFSYCYFRRGHHYRLFASLDEEPGYTIFRYDFAKAQLTLERDAAGVRAAEGFHAFDLFYTEGSAEQVFDAWFRAMGITPLTDRQLFGYSSWYNRYQNIDEAAIRSDLEGCAKIFKKGDLFQIDDGWEPYVGDWLEPDAVKFPGGMKAMVDEIHAKGFKAGLWLAPFVAEERSALYRDHQDWFLKVNGENWKDGCNWSGYYSLDIDHPEVLAYLEDVFTRVKDEWGFDLVKLDFLYAAAPFGNERESRSGRMIRAMKMIRKWCGDMKILGCGVPFMSAFGLVEYCRISCDVSLDWNDRPHMSVVHRERPSTRNAVTNIINRAGVNGRAFISDPDVFFLRSENISLTPEEKDDLALLDALYKGVFLTSDDPNNYTDEMKRKYAEFRYIAENAREVVFDRDNGLHVTYMLDGKHYRKRLFARRFR